MNERVLAALLCLVNALPLAVNVVGALYAAANGHNVALAIYIGGVCISGCGVLFFAWKSVTR
jgi:hypothetical protein